MKLIHNIYCFLLILSISNISWGCNSNQYLFKKGKAQKGDQFHIIADNIHFEKSYKWKYTFEEITAREVKKYTNNELYFLDDNDRLEFNLNHNNQLFYLVFSDDIADSLGGILIVPGDTSAEKDYLYSDTLMLFSINRNGKRSLVWEKTIFDAFIYQHVIRPDGTILVKGRFNSIYSYIDSIKSSVEATRNPLFIRYNLNGSYLLSPVQLLYNATVFHDDKSFYAYLKESQNNDSLMKQNAVRQGEISLWYLDGDSLSIQSHFSLQYGNNGKTNHYVRFPNCGHQKDWMLLSYHGQGAFLDEEVLPDFDKAVTCSWWDFKGKKVDQKTVQIQEWKDFSFGKSNPLEQGGWILYGKSNGGFWWDSSYQKIDTALFVMKLNNQKEILWIKSFHAKQENIEITDIEVDNNNHIWLIGNTISTIWIDSLIQLRPEIDSIQQPFIIHLDHKGSFINGGIFKSPKLIIFDKIVYSNGIYIGGFEAKKIQGSKKISSFSSQTSSSTYSRPSKVVGNKFVLRLKKYK